MKKIIRVLLASGPKYSWKKFITILLLSNSALIFGMIGTLFFIHFIKNRDSSFTIQAIVQKTPTALRLPAQFLEERLNLSVDKPLTFDQFHLKEAEATLLASGLIKRVQLKKIKPNLLLIDYIPREPYFVLDDYDNTVMDKEGFFFPYLPFYFPRNLPHLYLGDLIEHHPWGRQLAAKYLNQIDSLIEKLGIGNIDKIDLSAVEEATCGKKELILILKNQTLLRLTPKNYLTQLDHYLILERQCPDFPTIIDLRLTNIAFYTQSTPKIGISVAPKF